MGGEDAFAAALHARSMPAAALQEWQCVGAPPMIVSGLHHADQVLQPRRIVAQASRSAPS